MENHIVSFTREVTCKKKKNHVLGGYSDSSVRVKQRKKTRGKEALVRSCGQTLRQKGRRQKMGPARRSYSHQHGAGVSR